jgi:hypothetical protein
VQKQIVRSIFLAWIGCSLAISAVAQSPPKDNAKWEVELHAGKKWASGSADGSISLPEPGATFTTVNGGTSRMVTSWYFGDGALLLNQVQALDPSIPERIIPLDPVLAAPLAARQSDIVFGGRLSRSINSRFSGELTVDYGKDRMIIPSGIASQIHATSESFYSTWTSFFAAWKSSSLVRPFSVGGLTKLDQDKGSSQLLLDGTVNVALRTTGRIIPYISGGVGVISNSKERMRVNLTGSYASGTSNAEFINEGTSVSLRFEIPDHVVVGVMGGGVKYFVTPGWGLRFDARNPFRAQSG